MAAGVEPNLPMTPREYVEAIVLPTLHEFLAARDDRRRAYLACLVICHVADSLALAEAARKPEFEAKRGRPREAAVTEAMRNVQAVVERRCGAAKIVRDIANGTKHPSRLPLLPGTEEAIPAFAYDTPGAGLDTGRLDVPGLLLGTGEAGVFIDVCTQQVLAAFIQAYPAQLGGIALRSFMDPGLEVLGLDGEPEWLAEAVAWASGKPEAAELWLYEIPDAADPGDTREVGIALTDAAIEAMGGLGRAWAAGECAATHGRWRSELATIIGGDVELIWLGVDSEPGGRARTATRLRAIRLWTRHGAPGNEPVSLSTR